MPLLGTIGAGSARGFGFAGKKIDPPVNTVAPVITGTFVVGSNAYVSSNGTWTGTPPITYTYQWRRNGVNISGATSNPYVITNSDIGTILTCAVTATNSAGSVTAVSNQSSTIPSAVLGSALGGGYFVGYISTSGNGVATHYLVAAPRSSGQSDNLAIKSVNSATSGTGSFYDGASNTSAIVSAGSSPAGTFVSGLSIGGFTDWYIPSLYELTIFYYSLKPTTGANDTFSGANPYAVPARGSNYTSGDPTRTSNTDYQSNGSGTGGTEAMQTQSNFNAWFWVSTEYASNTNRNYRVWPGGGDEDVTDKTTQQVIRAFRKVPV